MFANFAVDEAALEECAGDSDRHDDLLELWAELGVLVLDSESWGDSSIYNAISQLPVHIKKRWQLYYKAYNSRTKFGPKFAQLLTAKYDFWPPELSRDVDAIFCGADLASKKIGKVTRKAKFFEEVEFVRFESCRRSEVFQENRSLRTREIADGTSTQDIWLERMLPIAELSRHVRVLDSYAIKNCFEQAAKSGLKSLFENLSESGKSFDLEIYAGQWEYPVKDIEAMIRALITKIGSHWLNSMDLYLVDKDIFRSCRHSRYIRFDKFVCETDKGVAVLDGDELRVPSTFLLKNVERTHRESEKKLRYHGERVVICS